MNLRTMFAAFVFGLTAPLAQAERTLEHEAVIAAPVADVWKAWTTNEGFASWAVA